ncbi:MAG: bifunctional ADP-dependent NAD(P)H-hydrate dehydratase/NAD(P)H-hydrate epimerase, partial [Nocardioidaceae bacterium]|nr:bifunctional ADP-dependent NAD(P)H-hydrate dehydratase/NAD(P)H-hydrate epimerase [Nocardioidaceae bacterium]
MRYAHTVDQVRRAEAALMAQVPEGTLMQRAALGLATAISDFLGHTYGARVLLVVGSGDNGGDALWAGAMLARRGAAVEAICLSGVPHPTGMPAFLAAGGQIVAPTETKRPDVVVDAVVGIGGKPGLRPDAEQAFELFPECPVIAVDVPSGVE